MIVDCHTHVWEVEHLGRRFMSEVRGAAGATVDLRSSPETHRVATRAADAVIVLGFRAPHIGVVVPNEYVAAYVRGDPARLVGYLSVDPTEPNARDEVDRAVDELGLRGVKLVPTYGNYHPLDERAVAIYEHLERRKLPVTFHMGTTPHPTAPLEFGRPGYIDEIARTFPNLRIVIAHVAHPWEAEALVIIRKHEHTFADVSGLVWRPFQLYHTLRLADEYAVDGKLLFGSDFPWLTTDKTISGLRSLCRADNGIGAPIREEVIEGIIERDALSLLGLARS